MLVQQDADLTGGLAVVAAVSDPSRLGYCGPSGIQLSYDAGQTWNNLPIDAVSGLAASSGYPLVQPGGAPSSCGGLTLDPSNPATIYASFLSERVDYGGPPFYEIPFLTQDNGADWAPVPLPANATVEQFGGFQVDDQGVVAVFAGAGSPVAQVTTDGGQSWRTQSLPCPAVGPCVRWGPQPNGFGSCAMHSYPQPVLVSADGGGTWSAPSGTSGADACRPAELVSLSANDVLLLVPKPAEPQAPSISHDGGLTWAPLDLPAGPPLAQLTLLPDGRLLAAPLRDAQAGLAGSGWLLLASNTSDWCPVPDSVLPDAPVALTAVAGELWWRADGAVQSLPVTAITCAS